MSREIKFRIYDRLNKIIWHPENIATLDFESKCAWIKQPYKSGHWVYFKNAEILQYTGLKDKNGKNYCQDDVVLYRGAKYHLFKGKYKFELLDFYESVQDNPADFFEEGAYRHGKVIGNIHEHPNLLEDE